MRCYHCAEDVHEVARWQVMHDGELRDVCCVGCESVMQAIVDAGLDDYYRFRTEPASFGVIPDDLAASLDDLSVFDEPEIRERYLRPVASTSTAYAGKLVDVSLSIEGMSCGACVWVLQRAIQALPGVENAQVNFSSSRASVRFDAEHIPLSEILKRTASMGYQGKPFDARDREVSLKKESRIFIQRLFVAGIAAMQVMMYALPAYISGEGDIEGEHMQLLRWASLVLTTPVLLYSAQPFLYGAYLDIRRRQPGMDVPVSLGILIAFSASVWATLTGSGETYFDSVAMFVFLLLGARYLEWRARCRAMRTMDDISASTPETAQRLSHGTIEIVPSVRLQIGDIIVVDSGQRVPVDCRVYQGQGAVNNALVTGESLPYSVGPGDTVAGGALLTEAALHLQVLRQLSASTLSVIDSLIERGANEKPHSVRLADRFASLFVSVLLILAALVFIVWLQIDPAKAGPTAIAVLVVSCPCALSLATPAVLATASSDLLRHHLLITRGHALETLAKVTDVVFDKTGTLTQGAPSLVSVKATGNLSNNDLQRIAAAMESGSSHPYAHAFRIATSESDLPGDAMANLKALGWPASHLEYAAGHGVMASLNSGGELRLGSASWCTVSDIVQANWHGSNLQYEMAASEVYMVHIPPIRGREPTVLGRFLLDDKLRSESEPLVAKLMQSGQRVHLLSGDRLAAVASVAKGLQVDQYRAAQTPEDKQAYVKNLQSNGSVVLMVGDGINDAPVLAIADVSVAAGDASSLARTASDVISLAPGLEGLTLLLGKARQSLLLIRQNLVWAALYNFTAIPMAALGYVPPWAAAVGMALSSLLVVGNAQRLWSKLIIADGPATENRQSPGRGH